MVRSLFKDTNNNQTRNIMMMGNRIIIDNEEVTKDEMEARLTQDQHDEKTVSNFQHSS